MYQKLLKNKTFNSKIKHFLKENLSEIFDIVLIGSVVRGKESPQDIDILLLFKTKENLDLVYELRKVLESLGLKKVFNVVSKTYASLMSETFLAREAYLAEGYSLITH